MEHEAVGVNKTQIGNYNSSSLLPRRSVNDSVLMHHWKCCVVSVISCGDIFNIFYM